MVVAMNIRGLAPKVRQALKERAARHGVSMEEEVRRILIHTVSADEPDDLAVVDGQIAAIARTKGASLTPRNVKDFAGCGLELQNPFDG